MIKLGDILNIKTGKLDANAKSEGGAYPFFTCSKEISQIDSYSYDCECVLVAGNGDLNVKYYRGKFDAYQRTYILESNGTHEIDMKFLYHFMSSYLETLRSQTIGGVIQYIKMGNLTDIKFSNYDLPTQKAIANKLDHIQSFIDQKKAAIAKTEELGKSIFVEMFGDIQRNSKNYETVELGKLGNFKSGGTPSRKHPEYFDGSIPRITTVSLGKHYIDKNDAIELITNEAVKKSSTKIIEQGSIIVGTRVGVGKVSINNCDICTNQDIVSISEIDKGLNAVYLSDVIRSYISFFESQKRGATIKGIKSDVLKGINIPIPSIEEQKRYNHIVDFLLGKLSNQHNSLNDLESLFAQQMQESFTIN